MSFRFKLDEPIAEGVSRIGLEQIAAAKAALAATDIAKGVHDARRCLKRLRALLRLVRPALEERDYRREMRRLAAIAQMLSGARDAHVMQQTLAKLAGRFVTLSRSAKRLRKALPNGAERKAGRDSAGTTRRAQAGLDQARALFAGIARQPIAFEHLAEGLQRSYRKARRTYREAYRHPADEAFHAWRKSAQQHWRHMQLLSRSWPDVLGGRASEAKELSRLLGDDHDLAVLADFVTRHSSNALPTEERAELLRICRSCQAEIRARAKPHGARLLAEPAKSLGARLAVYWSAAAQLATLAAPAQVSEAAAQMPATTVRRRTAAGAGSTAPNSSRARARRTGR
jgi:hypothetical protein